MRPKKGLSCARLPCPPGGPDSHGSPESDPASASRTGAVALPSGPSWGSRSRGGSSLGCRRASLGRKRGKPEWAPSPGSGRGTRAGPASGPDSPWLPGAGPGWFLLLLQHPDGTPLPREATHPGLHRQQKQQAIPPEMLVLNVLASGTEEIVHNGTSLVVQRVRLHAPNAGGPGWIPAWGTRSHMHATTKKSACRN